MLSESLCIFYRVIISVVFLYFLYNECVYVLCWYLHININMITLLYDIVRYGWVDPSTDFNTKSTIL